MRLPDMKRNGGAAKRPRRVMDVRNERTRLRAEIITVATTRTTGAQRMTRCLLVLFLVGICSRGYGYYNQDFKASPQIWMDVVHGVASAPEQYRVGIVMPAYWLGQHLGLRLSQMFGLIDLLSSVIAILLLYALLVKTEAYERASEAGRWFGSAAFLALTVYLVDWVNWYQKATTLPTACLVAVMLWLWTPTRRSERTTAQKILIAAAFLAIAIAQSFIRADVAVMVCAGLFVASVVGLGSLALPRRAALACSVVGGLLSVAVQVYLMKVLYPQATYGDVPVWMILHDWMRISNWASALIFMVPLLWTVRQVIRRRYWGEGAGAAFLFAAIGYAAIWLVMGRLDEVRIFLPMALVLTPLTVEIAMLRLNELQTTSVTP
jgi:hypothetical protein